MNLCKHNLFYFIGPRYRIQAIFVFFFLIGPWFGPRIWPKSWHGWMRPAGPDGADLGLKKTRFFKWGEFGFLDLARGSGLGIKKSAPNSIRCHSYLVQDIQLSTSFCLLSETNY